MKKLPVYELTCDDIDSYVDGIALVEFPAIEKEFMAFSKHKKIEFSLNEERMELIGPIMVPDQHIYRKNEDGYEYEVFFSRDTIRKIAQSFSKKGYQQNLNIEHSGKSADSFIYQSMIVDEAMGITPMNLPNGSWVGVVKVINKSVWDDIKAGKHKGFSIEGYFDLEQKFSKVDAEEQEFSEILDSIKKVLGRHI